MSQNNSIHILPENLANKIAAGEVVERPASVVKELVENSIDAGATRIHIVIEQGGKKVIQVIDDGHGISEVDLTIAFERHATSKIRSEKDLTSIHSLGFRGEALPSIASVSQIEIKTRHISSSIGYVYTINAGEPGQLKKTAANTGTSITVKNLFFNTPARRKFLKSDNAENQQILIVLKRFFLACPQIEFELTMDGKQIQLLKICVLKERIAEVFGKNISDEMFELKNSIAGINIHGFIANPRAARKSRTHQHLYINGRPILDRNINYAIYQGYGETLEEGSYPVYCLFIEVDPSMVDVNIHPAKMQVRFTNEHNIFYLFLNAVKKELNDRGVLSDFSSVASGSAIQKVIIDSKDDQKQSSVTEFELKKTFPTALKGRKKSTTGRQMDLAYFSIHKAEKDEDSDDNLLSQTSDINPVDEGVRFWQVHKKYIFSEIKSGLVIIDQHLAHARILYEKTLAVLDKRKKVNAQKLLFPQKITLALDDFLVYKEIYMILNQIGFTINVFSGNTIIIEEMPADVKIGRESQILLEIIDFYKNTPMSSLNPNEKIAAGYAYKNAVKNGEELNPVQMHNLVDQLFACEHPFYSPNGKPVIISMELDELARRFK